MQRPVILGGLLLAVLLSAAIDAGAIPAPDDDRGPDDYVPGQFVTVAPGPDATTLRPIAVTIQLPERTPYRKDVRQERIWLRAYLRGFEESVNLRLT